MPFKVEIVDKDTGYNDFKEKIKKLSKGTYAKVGVIGKKALEEKEAYDDNGKKIKEPVKLVDVATFHEFGSQDGRHPPQRSFLRSTYEEKKETWRAFLIAKTEGMINKLSLKNITEAVDRGLKLLGELMVADITNKFVDNDWEPLAEQTKEQRIKKRNFKKKQNKKFEGHKPLIDTGQLWRSIKYLIVSGKEDK